MEAVFRGRIRPVEKPALQIRRRQLLRSQSYEKRIGTRVLANEIHGGYLHVGCRILPGALEQPDATIVAG